MDADAATLLALEGLRASLDENANLSQVEVCTIQRDKGLHRLLPEEIQKISARLPTASPGGRASRS
jgi:20S proteasome alpha/beta subunit